MGQRVGGCDYKPRDAERVVGWHQKLAEARRDPTAPQPRPLVTPPFAGHPGLQSQAWELEELADNPHCIVVAA